MVAALCSMVFNIPHLRWDSPADHLELFAGVCAISSGEWKDPKKNVQFCFLGKKNPNVVFLPMFRDWKRKWKLTTLILIVETPKMGHRFLWWVPKVIFLLGVPVFKG